VMFRTKGPTMLTRWVKGPRSTRMGTPMRAVPPGGFVTVPGGSSPASSLLRGSRRAARSALAELPGGLLRTILAH
jgi:hypothetical protein